MKASPYIPKERLSAYERWEMASFDPVPPAPPAPVEIPDPYLGELAQRREQAHHEGYAAGLIEGHAAGHATGYDQGRALGLAEAEAQAASLQHIAASFKHALVGVDAEMAEHLVALAFDIARQVVRQDVVIDPTVILAAAREVIATEPTLTGAPHLLVNPADLPVVEAYLKDDLLAEGWTVRADLTVERGGCRAHAVSGEIDATLPTRWERVAAAIGRVLE
ncbi:flagellar assembly protein FliH [Burkholderia sp. L27(2015)]|uniref:flagellar assembly protein FliH n=1 Tax=Burkholderia sp. L27(2015) TaxID=1641858 RepID=UPI00131DAEF8|nr:flagellar assembly protein FliH [Burkholderia sp. L27(2015)]